MAIPTSSYPICVLAAVPPPNRPFISKQTNVPSAVRFDCVFTGPTQPSCRIASP